MYLKCCKYIMTICRLHEMLHVYYTVEPFLIKLSTYQQFNVKTVRDNSVPAAIDLVAN